MYSLVIGFSLHVWHIIYMFDRGCLVETGSHDELIELNGKYAEMFWLQAGKYKL